MRQTCLLLGLLLLCGLADSALAASAPVITKDITNQTTTVGQTVTFSLMATGSLPLRFQWRRDGNAISNATSTNFTLFSAQFTDNGAQFSALVTNNFGMVTSSIATLSVAADNTPPTVVKVGNTPDLMQVKVSFSERVSPGSATNVFNYQLDSGANVLSAVLQPNGSNVTLNVSTLVEGTFYTLLVSDIFDLANNVIQPNPAQVAFEAALPPMITVQPQSQAVNPGDSVVFFVSVSGTEPYSYQWYKGNNALAGATDSDFSVTNIQAQQLGNYYAVISNPGGVVTSAVAQLSFAVSYTLNLPSGYSFVANQLRNPQQGFPIPPDGTTAFKWNVTQQKFDGALTYFDFGDPTMNGWYDGQGLLTNFTLVPGEGGIINLPSAASLTFVGQIIPPVLPVSLAPGFNLLSAQVPKKADYSDIVGPPQEGSIVYRFRPGRDPNFADDNNFSINYFRFGVWHDGPPVANVGESVFVSQMSPVVITTQPTDHTNVPPGQSVTFSVSATGTPPIRYQWRLNGTAIPGATNPDYVINPVAPANAGTYSVAVGNAVGDIISDKVRLTLSLPFFPMADDFSTQPFLNSPSQLFSSNNRNATREPGEPFHAGKNANASVWFTWVAPFNGIVTMGAGGSGFDTILAAYVGNTVSSLTLVDANDDDAGYACSRIMFNAHAGVAYRICVAGLGDETGDIILGWNLEDTQQVLPEIAVQPQDVTVTPGGTAQFFIVVTNGNFSYQWFHDGVPIQDAIQPTLTINNVGIGDLGNYYVRIFNAVRSRDSESVSLQIETAESGFPISGARATAKFFDVGFSLGGSGQPLKGPPPKLGGTVNRGYSGSQTVSSVGAGKDPGEPNHCGVTGGNSVWYTVQATNNGTLYVNTDGSSFNTVLAAYVGPGYSYATLTNVACDNNSGLDGLDSRISFMATSNTIYYMAVDGVSGASGTVVIAYHLVRPLSVTNVTYSTSGGEHFTMKVIGTPNLAAIVQGSTNFNTTNWTSLFTNTSTTGIFNYTNNGLGSVTNRFYRAINSF